MNSPRVNGSDIQDGLTRLGLQPGDVTFVHSSLSAFGHVEGGAKTVIDALLEVLGPSGTLVMPTFTWGDFHAKPVVVFDLCNSPCETGRIPETFRKREGVLRSVHVCHSVSASGGHASDVLGDGISSFGPGSTFDALLNLDAWIVFLGVTFQCCTALHAVEEFVRVPYRKHRDYKGSTVILPDGSRIPSESIEYLRQDGSSNDFAKMGAILDEKGVLKKARIGSSDCMSVRIRDLFKITQPLLEQDSGFLSRPRSI
jgi:aminoglycoside 3-N-acetyltransferase